MSRVMLFPIINGLVMGIVGAVVGLYAQAVLPFALGSLLIGFVLAAVIEWLGGRFGRENWLFRRRVLGVILLELVVMILFVGPYAYVGTLMASVNPRDCCPAPPVFAPDIETVSIPIDETVAYAGWYHPPRADHGGTIILLHGSGSDRRGTQWHAEHLYEAGFGLLMLDSQGHGATGGSYAWGIYDYTDLSVVLDWLAEQPEVGPVGGVGLSLGAHILIQNAAHDDRLAALWLDWPRSGVDGRYVPDADDWRPLHLPAERAR